MRLAIVTGEASGDRLGADLMQQLDAEFEGIGGYQMTKEGLRSIFPMEELSVMGIAEVLPKARHLLRRVRETAEFVLDGNFDALVTIDSPDFSHRVAKKVKKSRPDFPVIHYVAPSVWAWRAGRAKKMAHHVDHVLCLLPFEPPYMEAAGMSADFVGHPVSRQKPPKGLAAWQKKHPNTLGFFPGSRRSEISNHINIYREFLKQVDKQTLINLPTSDFLYDELSEALKSIENIDIFSPSHGNSEDFDLKKSHVIYGSNLAICTSGTISFELAWADTNCIVGYRTNKLNEWIYRRMIKVKYASLANILLGEEAIPELIFDDFNSENLNAIYQKYMNSDRLLSEQKDAYLRMRQMMIPEIDAATSVKQFLEKR